MHLRLGLAALVIGLAILGMASVTAFAKTPELNDGIIERSLVDAGNPARLQAVLDKARRGEQVRIAVMGGSITQGTAASTTDKCYASLLNKWWKTTFPMAKVKFTNVGVGATGSEYGALRAQRDLGKVQPDFVVVEFAVNDNQTPDCARSMEGLVRQLLGMDSKPAVLLLFTMLENGTNAQEWHTEVGLHYGLPMISMRDALYPEVEAGRIGWREIEADEVHPNDVGHALLARLVTAHLERVLATLPATESLPRVSGTLPQPLYTDMLENVSLFEGKALKPTANEGWTYDASKGGWKSKVPGSAVEFEVEGRELYLMASHVHGPMGMARVRVDDMEPFVIDGWFEQTWGTWKRLDRIASDLKPGVHRIRVELLQERNGQSKGNEFVVNAVGGAGLGSR